MAASFTITPAAIQTRFGKSATPRLPIAVAEEYLLKAYELEQRVRNSIPDSGRLRS